MPERGNIRPSEISSVRRHNEMGSLWTQLLLQFLTDLFETLQVFCHGLKICIWFCGYHHVIFYQLFPLFRLSFFSGQITIRIDILWAQILLEFSTDHLKTRHTCSTWSEDVHVVLGLSCHYLFSTFCFFFQLSFFSYDTIMWVTCGRNSSYSFIPNV